MGLPEDTHHCYSVHECFDGVTSACSAVPAPSSPTSPCRLRSWPAVGRCAQCCVHHGCVRLPPAIVVAVRAVWLTRTVWLAWNRWGEREEPKFVFTVKLFMESLKSSPNAKAQYMFFIQAVYSVICGIYPVTEDEAVQLAALQVLQKFGTHKPDV